MTTKTVVDNKLAIFVSVYRRITVCNAIGHDFLGVDFPPQGITPSLYQVLHLPTQLFRGHWWIVCVTVLHNSIVMQDLEWV